MADKPKRVAMLRKTITADAAVIETAGFPAIRINRAELTPELVAYAAMMGVGHRIGDAAALSVVDGRRPTAAEKHAAMVAVADAIRAGKWGVRDAAGASDAMLLLRAMAEALSTDPDSLRAEVDGYDTATVRAMLSDPAIAPIADRMRREAATARGIDTGAKLDELRARMTAR